MSLTEKVAYIKGLVDGNGTDDKIINLLIDLLDDLAHDVTALKEENETLREYIEEIDDDLGYLEDVVYEDLDGECDDVSPDCDYCDGDCEDCMCDDDCDSCDRNSEYDFFKVTCPSCNEQVYLDNSIDPSNVICPSCHNKFSATDGN